MKAIKNILLISLILVSCTAPKTDSAYFTADIRKELNNPGILSLSDEIESVSFVPLEITSDDASLIDGVVDYAITDKYIYVLPVQEPRIILFDRQGRFLRTLIRHGQGPGEFSGLLAGIQADEKNNRLYLLGDRIWIYTLEGEFIEHLSPSYRTIFQRRVGKDRFAAVAFPYSPFQTTCFGLGIFSDNGDTIATKNDFYSPLVPREKSGFTVLIAASYSDQQKSILFKTGSNDTIFRISARNIQPVCILNLQNSDKEIVRSLDVTDFSSLREDSDEKDIFVSELFETSRRYYFRLRHNQGNYVASVDKETGKTQVEKCTQPGTIRELADANILAGMLGTRSYHNFPVWGRTEGNYLVQVVTPLELNKYKDISSITIPDNLKGVDEEGNPIFVFYALKE